MRAMPTLIILIIGLQGHSVSSLAQDLDDLEIISVENLYKEMPPAQVEAAKNKISLPLSQEEIKEQHDVKNNIEVRKSQIKSLTDLNKLAPFSNVSTIQKKYLPKTERFQFFAAGGLMTNSPWFLNLGAKLNLAYHFSESFGVEATGMLFTNTESEAAKEIRSNNSLQPDKFVITQNTLSLDLLWSPIYGKIADLNDTIIPFDMYFSFGGGISSTNSQEGSVPTFHIGTGQIFALSKSIGFRWDYSWNMYQATPVAVSSTPSKSNYNDLIFTAGISFFFPEATNR